MIMIILIIILIIILMVSYDSKDNNNLRPRLLALGAPEGRPRGLRAEL